jgi:hypothetical protein
MTPKSRAGALAAGAGLLAAGCVLPGGADALPQCDPGWFFKHPRRVDKKLVVFDRERDENLTHRGASATFTANHGGTVSWSMSGGFGGGAEADLFGLIKTSVEANLNVQVARSLHAEVGNAITVHVPPHRAVVGHYGVFKLVVRGHLYYLTRTCQRQHNRPRVRVKLPHQIGWRVSQHQIHRR